jgi:hypothetical protein
LARYKLTLPKKEWFHCFGQANMTSNSDEDDRSAFERGGSVPSTIRSCSASLVQLIVKLELWPKVKFVTDDQLLFTDDERSICIAVCNSCNVAEQDREWFWRKNQKEVKKTLARKRTDVTNALKEEFMGKCWMDSEDII